MDVNNLTDHQAQLLMEMRLVFEPQDWVELDKIYVAKGSEFNKVFHMETLLVQARNKYVRTHGQQPYQDLDDELENII